MKIFYTASFGGKRSYQRNYNVILRYLEQIPGIEVISPEKGNYLDVLPRRKKERLKTQEQIHYEAIRKGILSADAVIIEISHQDFQLGHEATLAIQNKKYVLCLSVHEDFSEKIRDHHFVGAKYNEYNIEELLENFIIKVEKERFSERFNCFLSPRQVFYLKSVAKLNGMNTSEYLRKLIDDDRSENP